PGRRGSARLPGERRLQRVPGRVAALRSADGAGRGPGGDRRGRAAVRKPARYHPAMRWRMCAAAALVAGAGCGEEAPGLADAGPRPEPAEPCAFAADEPGARAAYVTRGADGAAAVYVVDV